MSLVCKLCGRTGFQLFAKHLRAMHNMSRAEYVKQFDAKAELEQDDKVQLQLRQQRSPSSISFYLNRGMNEAEAVLAVKRHGENMKLSCSKGVGQYPKDVEYWLKRGLSQVEAEDKVAEFITAISISKELMIAKYGEVEGVKRYDEWRANLLKRPDVEVANIAKEASCTLKEAKSVYVERRRYAWSHSRNKPKLANTRLYAS